MYIGDAKKCIKFLTHLLPSSMSFTINDFEASNKQTKIVIRRFKYETCNVNLKYFCYMIDSTTHHLYYFP